VLAYEVQAHLTVDTVHLLVIPSELQDS
jgi:hypothetical protein